MPDWRIKEEYNFTNELTLEGWAWEFLRRNPLYRHTYEGLQNDIKSLENIHGDFSALSQNELYEIKGAYIFTPARKKGESIGAWNRRCLELGEMPEKLSLSVWKAKEWGIKGPMVDPFDDDAKPPRFISTPNYPKIVNREECLDYFSGEGYEQNPPYVLVGFNLRYSFNDQINILKQTLSEMKDNLRSEGTIHTQENMGHKQLWVDHLRLLDGLNDGASITEIGRVLFSHIPDAKARNDKVYERRKTAIQYRDTKFRYLPERIT